MNYEWLSYEEIKKCKYPNLLAELKESGHSICTIGEHLGMGRYCEEDNPVIWNKLRNGGITASEGMRLARLFGVTMEYLFASELTMFGDIPMAKQRWAKWNEQKKSMIRCRLLTQELKKGLEELDIETIERVSRAWTAGMQKEGMPDNLIAFCNKLAEVVIQHKRENGL